MHDTTGHPEHTFTRRAFLGRGLTLASMAGTVPFFLEHSARAMMAPADLAAGSRPGVPEERILVVVQLGGGNDGLNTVVPFGSADYYRARPSLAIPDPTGRNAGDNAALMLNDVNGIGLHPSLTGLKDLFDEGAASIIQGVGYPNPNRSHFTSMDIWHTADTNGNGDGWLGRYFDAACAGTPQADLGVAIGRQAPLAMLGRESRPVSFESADLFQWMGTELHESLEEPYHTITRRGALVDDEPNPQAEFLMRTALDAQVSSDRIRQAVRKTPLVEYPRNRLAGQLRIVSAMIRDELPTRVYYVSLGGFDTHANQGGTQANLLRQVGDSLKVFHRDMQAQSNSARVLTMVFSEFGRRVAQNASGGTDHGTAAPVFLVGDPIRPGLLGDHPSLTQLDQGDLIFNVDFRCLYAALLEDWMGADSTAVLGRKYKKAQIVKA